MREGGSRWELVTYVFPHLINYHLTSGGFKFSSFKEERCPTGFQCRETCSEPFSSESRADVPAMFIRYEFLFTYKLYKRGLSNMILNCRNNPVRKTVDKAEVRCGVRGDWHCCKENEGELTPSITGILSQIRTKLLDWAVWQARASC